MKVVYLNTFGNYGGAAIAALRSLQAARSQGIDTTLLAGYRVGKDENIQEAWPGLSIAKKAVMTGEILSYLVHAADKKQKFIFSPGAMGLPVASHPLVRQADVIHLHWTHQGLLSLRGMEKIFSMGKPVVITLHDQWYMTGGCYTFLDCEGYLYGCTDCPLLKKGSKLASKILEKKIKLFSKYKITTVAISQWMLGNIKNSPALRDSNVHYIPNAIDTNVFRAMDRHKVLEKLGLDPKKKRIGFVAVNINDPHKGASYLLRAVEKLSKVLDPALYELLVIGRNDFHSNLMTQLNIVSTGYVQPDTMPLYYNAMDVFVLPSITENLPNSIMEALSCGIPVVGFAVGGVPDMVKHKENGYLSKVKDADDLAQGIEWILKQADYQSLKQKARESVKEKFSYPVIGKKLLELYQNIV